MTPEQISAENSRKLDHIVWLLDGDGDNPGVLHRLGEIAETLYGKQGAGGIVSKVNVMWRIHTWLLCTLSGGLGVLGTLLIQKIVKP